MQPWNNDKVIQGFFLKKKYMPPITLNDFQQNKQKSSGFWLIETCPNYHIIVVPKTVLIKIN